MRSSEHKSSKPGSVRIIGGIWRRRRISLPAGVDLRPTPDRVRETLFNWLGPVLPGAVCLDLFAGSGVLGLEALSRGAARATFVERNEVAAAALEQLCRTLEASARVIRGDALGFLTRSDAGEFDLAFVDPPFAEPVDATLAALREHLKPGARVYLERPRAEPWPEPSGLEWIRRSTAGAVAYGLGRLAA